MLNNTWWETNRRYRSMVRKSTPKIFVYFTTVLEILLSNIAYFGLDLREWLHLVAISYSGVRNLNLFPFCFQRKSNRENEDEANTQSNAFILLDNSSSLSKTKKLGFYSIFRWTRLHSLYKLYIPWRLWNRNNWRSLSPVDNPKH